MVYVSHLVKTLCRNIIFVRIEINFGRYSNRDQRNQFILWLDTCRTRGIQQIAKCHFNLISHVIFLCLYRMHIFVFCIDLQKCSKRILFRTCIGRLHYGSEYLYLSLVPCLWWHVCLINLSIKPELRHTLQMCWFSERRISCCDLIFILEQ